MNEDTMLRTNMIQERNKWARMVRVYGTAYVIVRIFLIVASSIVAAKTALTANHTATLLTWVPVLAILIAIFTALDTWMKPQQKWQGFMRDRDDLEDLLSKLEEVKPGSDENEAIRKKFKSLRQRHRENNVF